MSKFLPIIADRVLGRPLLIDPGKAEVILAVLEGRILPALGDGEGAAAAELEGIVPQPEASRFVGSNNRQDRKSFVRASKGTAIVSVDGSLVNRGAWIGANSGLTSYEGIGAQLDDIAADNEIRNVVIDMNSFGGEATGMFGLASKVRALSKKKRVVAVVNDVAASAGYGIIAGADEIVVSPTSYVGSIGVVMMHVDRSGEMQMKGLRPTFIHAGAHKVDGHPFGALSDDVRAALQRDVNSFYDRFIEVVEAGRGKSRLSAAKARATEARTFIGQDAIAAGLADRVGSFDEVLAELQRPTASSGGKSKQERTRMDGIENAPQATGISQEAHNTAVATATKNGATAERTRIKSILTHDNAKGREATATHLALETDMAADAAVSLLATLPANAPAAAVTTPDPAAAPAIPTIEQRAQGAVEMGGAQEGAKPEASVVKAGWAKAVARLG